MSGFNYYARMVRDSSRSYGRRYIALRQTVSGYAFLRRVSFEATYAALADRFGFGVDAPRPTLGQMVAALEHVEADRRRFLVRLGEFATMRRQEKRLGYRHLRPGQLEELFPSRDASLEVVERDV